MRTLKELQNLKKVYRKLLALRRQYRKQEERCAKHALYRGALVALASRKALEDFTHWMLRVQEEDEQ